MNVSLYPTDEAVKYLASPIILVSAIPSIRILPLKQGPKSRAFE